MEGGGGLDGSWVWSGVSKRGTRECFLCVRARKDGDGNEALLVRTHEGLGLTLTSCRDQKCRRDFSAVLDRFACGKWKPATPMTLPLNCGGNQNDTDVFSTPVNIASNRLRSRIIGTMLDHNKMPTAKQIRGLLFLTIAMLFPAQISYSSDQPRRCFPTTIPIFSDLHAPCSPRNVVAPRLGVDNFFAARRGTFSKSIKKISDCLNMF